MMSKKLLFKYLRDMSDEDKRRLIEDFNRILGVAPLKDVKKHLVEETMRMSDADADDVVHDILWQLDLKFRKRKDGALLK